MPDVEAGLRFSTAPQLFPPVDYSPGWAILALAIVLAIIAFYVLVPILLRSKSVTQPPRDDETRHPELVREKYRDLIDEVASAHHRGELGVRAAHQRLSLLLRFFAYESSGLRAPQMTLADLRQTHATPLVDAVEKLYPGAFREIERGSVDHAAEMAREVVRSWN